MKLFLKFLTIIFSIAIFSCANVVTPTGGPSDNIAPVVVKYTPDSNKIYFDATEIQIEFNEYIILNDVFNQVVISPPLEGTPTFKIKGKTLNIDLNSSLKDSTTYTINFGEAIKDNTEGNVLNNFTYVFSTGSYLDSLEVSGKVNDILTGAPSEKTYVLLYYQPTDTSFTKTKPYYFAKTDKTGNFIIRNIRPGTYSLYAIEDQNFNYYYDLPNEKIAFQTTSLIIDSNISGQKLLMFSENKLDQDLLEIKSTRYGQVRLAFATNAENVNIEFPDTDQSRIHITRNKTNDTILIWNKDPKIITQKIKASYDTVVVEKEIDINKPIPADSNFLLAKNIAATNVVAFTKGGDPNLRADWDLNKRIELFYNNPTDTNNILQPVIIKDSLVETPVNVEIDSLDSRRLYINYKWKAKTNYDIIIPEGIFKDIFGISNEADTIKIKTKSIDAYSVLNTTIINTTGKNLIFQLLKFDLSLVEEIYIPSTAFSLVDNKYTIKLSYLVPGVYRIRAIIDSDNNGKWSPGDLNKNILPETVIFFQVDQNLRANWENEITWEIK